MSELQRACLSFCIELLNQTIHNRGYDMASVCALAALGVSSSGRRFRSADMYPSILSAIIKVAHFMIVQQAEQFARQTDSWCEDVGARCSGCWMYGVTGRSSAQY